MTAITKLLRATAGERAIDRVFLVASLLIIAVLIFNIRSTVSGMNVNVIIGSIESVNE
ncbi:MAG: hypothetical protein ACW96M_02430 [Candidatus Thorarchaeota archaeon]|jgi:hypothetical protein